MADGDQHEVRLANGDVEIADSLWGAHHVIARCAAFDADPLKPRNVLPARISRLGKQYFGGRVFVEEILSLKELSANEPA